jgi:hypothetical protein
MKVINGKWQDQYGEPIDYFNAPQLMEIGQKVKAVYGEDITCSRIELVSSIINLSEKEERSLAHLLNRDDVSFSKLAGF